MGLRVGVDLGGRLAQRGVDLDGALTAALGDTSRRMGALCAPESARASPMPSTSPRTASEMLRVPSPDPIMTMATTFTFGSEPTANVSSRASRRCAWRL